MAGGRSTRWFWLSAVTVAADRATKAAIETYTPENYHQPIVPGLVHLVHSHNPGIAFGMLADLSSKWLTGLLIASSAAVIGILCWLLGTGRAGGTRGQAGVALILGGAAGNLADRLLRGTVTDFFEVRLGSFHWPAFNAADSAITIGAVLVVLELLFSGRHPTKTRA